VNVSQIGDIVEQVVGERSSRPEVRWMADRHAMELARMLAEIADRKKAEDIVILDVTGRHSLYDLFVIVTANGARLAQTIGDDASHHARSIKVPRHLEKAPDWVCGDFGDVVLHVFTPEARQFYDIEHLWADAPRVAWGRSTAATGTTG